MDDLISRQAAIDAYGDWYVEEGTEDGFIGTVKQLLEGFPSAQLGTNLAEVGTDCISRQDAIDALRNYLVGKNVPCDGTLTCRLIENEVISKLPSAQRTGKWLDANICGELPVIVCDQCNTFYPLSFGEFHNFCPNCGAKMEGADDE